MTTLRIDIDDNRRWFLPGDTVSGRAVWHLDEPGDAIELSLFWHTSGKGTEDVEIVESLRFDGDGTRGDRGFSFRLPLGPYSFSGTLITLAWGLELVSLPDGAVDRVDLVVAPTPVEVELSGLDRAPMGFGLNLTVGPNKR